MLINIQRNAFRVCAAADPDALSALTPAQVALLGFTLAAGASGLVPYGPEAGSVSKTVQASGVAPYTSTFSYQRLAGPIDIAAPLAISLVEAGFATIVGTTGPDDVHAIPTAWAAGSIAGEADIPIAEIDAVVPSAIPAPAPGSTALPVGAWLHA